MAEKRCFQARWANFFAETRLEGERWASFFAEMRLEGERWVSFDATRSRQLGPSIGDVSPSMRSYTHLVVAGRGRPPLAPATLPATQSVDKGKVPSGQGRDKP